VPRFHEFNRPANSSRRKRRENNVIFEDRDLLRARRQSRAKAAHVGLEDSQLAVHRMLVDDYKFDKISQTNTLELRPRALAAVRSIRQRNTVDPIECLPWIGKPAIRLWIGKRLGG